MSQLTDARKAGDIERANKILDKLNEIEGRHPVSLPQDNKWQFSVNPNPVPNGGDYNWSTIHALGSRANAVCTVPVGAPNAGRIWVAATQYVAAPGGDSLKLYYSDNGGNSWVYYAQLYAAINIDFRSNELDIEPVWVGTTLWLFGIAGYYDVTLNQSLAVWFRFNLSAGGWVAGTMAIPGYTTATNNYSNPRITSDNSAYQVSPWVFMIVALDSVNAGVHISSLKGITCTNPTATTPTFDYTQPSGGHWYWWGQAGTGIYQYVDVGWFIPTSGAEMMYVSMSYSPGNSAIFPYNIYTSWSTDRGYTTLGNLSISETSPTKGTRIAFNGGTGSSNQCGMLVYLRSFSGANWDVRYQNTTNGGITPGGWTAGYIDVTTGYASGWPDVIALRGGANTFKATYSEGTSTAGSVRTYYSGFSSGSWSTPIVVSPIEPDTVFGCSRAGYLNGGGDDCLTIWRGSDAVTRDSRLCTSTIGIGNNNESPKVFSLSQNYPNPFNPTTEIKLGIPKSGLVKLVVYNILGQEVATLVNEVKEAGNYVVNFNAVNLPSGIYFYKLTYDGFTDSKKMLMVK
jgi:hypothetical protein